MCQKGTRACFGLFIRKGVVTVRMHQAITNCSKQVSGMVRVVDGHGEADALGLFI